MMKLLLISLLGMVAVQVSLHQRNLESFGENFKTEFLSVARCCPIPIPWDEPVLQAITPTELLVEEWETWKAEHGKTYGRLLYGSGGESNQVGVWGDWRG